MKPSATRELEKRAPTPAAPQARPGQGLSDIYRNTVRSRCLDERMGSWAAAGQLGFYLPALEWGGPLAAVAAALEAGDWLFPGAREARMALWRGFGLPAFLSQHLGAQLPEGGYLPTMPGSIADAAHRVASVAGGPAAHLPHAVGAAYAAVYRKEKGCAVAICSAAAVASPDFHVACNFAGVWRVPVLFLVRGDREDAAAVEVEARAEGYGLTAAQADGNDLEAVWKIVREALERGRAGAGATLVEIGQPGEEGGLAGLRRKLGNGSRPDDAALAAEATAWCDESWAVARAAARPGVERLTASVFAGEERHLTEELAELTQAATSLPEDV
jgi:TPP-dependent pyruvate/acetoin dehydrogenase alpha subunit